jgi:hypothetical protein
MQILYVAKFDLSLAREGGGTTKSSYDVALECLARWLTFLAGEEVEASTLAASGSRELRPSNQYNTKSARWEVAGSEVIRAVRLEIRDRDGRTGESFFTRVTVGNNDSGETVRVSMAREFPTTWLTPVPAADIRQPRIVSILLDEKRLVLAVEGQAQDGRYLQIRTDDEVDELIAALKKGTRLPIFLIHTRTLPAQAAARSAAAKLVGLVRVVTLDLRSARLLDVGMPGFAPPYAGARLVWSDCSVPTHLFDSESINGADNDWLRRELTRRVAPISALSRRGDDDFRRARQAELAAHRKLSQARVQEAEDAGDESAQIVALRQQLGSLQEEVKIWEDAVTQAEESLAEMRTQAERVPFLEQRVEQLNSILIAPPAAAAEASNVDLWESLPNLTTGSELTAAELYLQLEDLSERHIVFTNRASTSWKKSKYPYPEEMKDALVKLARVAVTLYDGKDRVMPHLDEWIHTEFELRVALNDEVVERTPKLHRFTFEGSVHNRTPHVKVRDGVALQHVGRIHFALDTEGARIIVDHVGVKLY